MGTKATIVWLVWWMAAASASGCAKSLDDLAPFPCADDGSCPLGLACAPGVGCTTPQIDSLCEGGLVECSQAAAGADCVLGVCAEPCSGSCSDEGRVCSSSTDGGCLLDCADGGECPDGLVCTELFSVGGAKACTAPGNAQSACKSVSASACGDPPVNNCSQESLALTCGGGFCPLHSWCTADEQCSDCDDGYTLATCSDNGKLWCEPNESTPTPGCSGDLTDLSGTCNCADGTSPFFDCGTSGTCTTICQQQIAG